MTKIKALAFTAVLALSLLGSTTGALAKDAKHGRETAWTDLGPQPITQGVSWETTPSDPGGVTWEE
jgi:hypothetical protein